MYFPHSRSHSLSLAVSCYSYSWMTTRPSEKLTWNQRNAEQKVEGRPSKRNRQKAMAKQSETKQEMSQRNEKWNKWETTTTTTRRTAREIMWYTSHKKWRQRITRTQIHVENEISKLAKMKWKSKAVNANKRRRIYSWVFFAVANLFLLT